jgi:hypothetical protein
MNDGNRVLRWPRRVLPLALRVAAAIIATAGLALLAGCGGSPGSHVAQRGSTAMQISPSPNGSGGEYLSFAKCMRSRGVTDFPDPVTGNGGHPGFHLQGGSNSDLNANDPAFQRGVEGCQHILGHEFKFIFGPAGVGKGA